MPLILLRCKKCKRIFSSGINLGVGATITLKGNLSQCPFCGSMENIPDGTFRGAVEDIVRILEQSDNPLNTAKDLLKAFENSRTEDDLSKLKKSSQFSRFQKWVSDSLEKIYYYTVILQAIIQLLTRNPIIEIEVNNVMKTYNHIIISQTK